MRNRFLSLFVVATMALSLFATTSNVYAHDNIESKEEVVSKQRLETDEVRNDPLHDYVPTEDEMNFLAKPYLSRSSTIWVPVTSPCDQAWRNTYPNNWMWQANRAITNADDMLSNKFGIEFYSVAQKYWDSSSSSAKDLVAEAKNEWGLTDGATLMIAFTGKNDGNKMGRVYDIGVPYVLILDHQYEDNRETVQHEVGHAYGLEHRDGDNNCVMIDIGMGHIDTICSTHEQQWKNNKNKY